MAASKKLAACRTLVVDSEKRPRRGQFLPDFPPHSPAMGKKPVKNRPLRSFRSRRFQTPTGWLPGNSTRYPRVSGHPQPRSTLDLTTPPPQKPTPIASSTAASYRERLQFAAKRTPRHCSKCQPALPSECARSLMLSPPIRPLIVATGNLYQVQTSSTCGWATGARSATCATVNGYCWW